MKFIMLRTVENMFEKLPTMSFIVEIVELIKPTFYCIFEELLIMFAI